MASPQKHRKTETTASRLGTEVSSSSHGSCKAQCAAHPDQFPAGLRVLAVDDDVVCLKILEQMLRKCLYQVTTCCQATVALSMVREKKGGFDIIISDVHMPDMDGYKLLEHVGLEMDLPVIMMSADGGTSSVMRGIKHGACDYLIKPVRIEELKNIWQHVIRKRYNENKELEDNVQHRKACDGADYASSFNPGIDGNWKAHKKRRDVKEDEDDGELDNGDLSTSKKPRVVWSAELHQQFVNAVEQLGIEKALPKRILELMNVPGLTRENVASHLQKFRLYLKKLSAVYQEQDTTTGSFGGPIESRDKSSSVGRADLQGWATSGLIPSQKPAALHAELLGQPSLFLPGANQHLLHHTSLQGFKSFPIEGGMPVSQPMLEHQSGISKLFSQPAISSEDIPSAFPEWPPHRHGPEGSTCNIGGLNTYNGNHFGQMLRWQQQQQQFLVHPESRHTLNLRTSCLIAASQPSNSFQHRGNSVLINQSSNTGNNTIADCNVLPPQLQNASFGHAPDRDLKNVAVLSGCSFQGITTSSSISSSLLAERGTWLQEHDTVPNMNSASRLLGPASSTCKIQPWNRRSAVLKEQVQWMNFGFVGKGPSIPSPFTVYDIDSTTDDESHDKICK